MQKKGNKECKKAQFRQYPFDLLTKQVGKGEKNSLKRVKIVDKNNEVIREC